jgi:hypothetical protein
MSSSKSKGKGVTASKPFPEKARATDMLGARADDSRFKANDLMVTMESSIIP